MRIESILGKIIAEAAEEGATLKMLAMEDGHDE
jgi:hypothetical protein